MYLAFFNARDSAGLSRTAGAFVDTVDILESRLGSVESRVSGIERHIIRSSKRRRNGNG